MTTQKSLYDDVWFYDLFRERHSSVEQVNFYKNKIERFGEPVLELACGTGFYLIPLAKEGVEISGLDLSEKMLQAARVKAEKENIKADVYQGDMRQFDLARRFKLIFIAANSLLHLHSFEDIERCFASVKRHLEPDGKFIIEIYNPSVKLLAREPDKSYLLGEFETGDGKIIWTENVRYDAATQINQIDWHYGFENSGQINTLSFALRVYFAQEFAALLHYNGLKIEEKYGDFDGSPFRSDSPKQIIVAGFIQ